MKSCDLPNSNDQCLFNIKALKPRGQKIGVMIDIHVDILTMELDTGASVSIILEKTWRKVLQSQHLSSSPVKLRTYTTEPLAFLGRGWCLSNMRSRSNLPLIVVAGTGPLLLGLNWLEQIKLDWFSQGAGYPK